MIAIPVEMRSRIRFTPRRDVRVTRAGDNRVSIVERTCERAQSRILRIAVRNIVRTLEFDANREIIAMGATAPQRLPRMPGAALTRHELKKRAIAANKKMRGNTQCGDALEIRMRPRIKPVHEQINDGRSVEDPRRQTDVVDDQQINRGARRAIITIR